MKRDRRGAVRLSE
uniref:Uncharacterized protein n=1 Tax=Anguilla anguilla TaxID=7936 RepID=A0A0E9XIN7_ANGAN